MPLADTPAGQDHGVAGFEPWRRRTRDRARKIDAGHERELSHDLAGAGDRQRVLVVQRRVGDVHQDLARRQIGAAEVCEGRAGLALDLHPAAPP